MTEPTTPDQHLWEAAAQLRLFNHTSQPPTPDRQHPADSHTAIGALNHLTRMLPQAIEQALRPALATHEAGHLTVTTGTPTQQAAVLKTCRDSTIQLARQLVTALDETHRALSPMGAATQDDRPAVTP